MKKTLIAAALLAGFAGAAQAETSVTLYGLVDLGLAYQRITGPGGASASKFGVTSGNQNGSRWGLRGTEDLGDGLHAVFDLESGFSANDGTSLQGSRLFGRQSTVGLAGDSWGEVDFGRQSNIASKYFGTIDPFGEGFLQAEAGQAFSSTNTQRYDNMVLFQTASYSGLQAGLGYSFNTNSSTNASGFSSNDSQRAITGGVHYINGPINLTADYDQLNPAATNAAINSNSAREVVLGGSYDFEVVKLALGYSRTSGGWFAGQGTTPFDNSGLTSANASLYPTNKNVNDFHANSYLVGLTAPIGASSSLFGSWQHATPSNANLTGDDAVMNTYSVGYTYDLSKRTNLYALASYTHNFAFLTDVSSTLGVVGIRHRF